MRNDYSVEVGTFYVKRNALDFNKFDLRVPLVRDTLIGRARTNDEHELSVNGPNYDGKKMIISDNELTSSVSRDHGRLSFVGEFPLYTHLSASGMGTSLWIPEQNLLFKTVTGNGDVLDLMFDEHDNDSQSDRYLLLGGNGAKNVRSLRELFPYSLHLYYVKVIKGEKIKLK